jgi:hypothetical protein
MGRLEKDGSMSAHQLTDDLNAKNPLERARLMAKQEVFAIVGDRVLGQTSMYKTFILRYNLIFLLAGQMKVTRCELQSHLR